MGRKHSSGVKDHDANAHEFCTSAKESANFDVFYDRQHPALVVDRVGNPKMPFGNVTDVDAAMSKRYGMFTLTDIFANELDRIARSNVLVDIAAAINSFRRFAFELSDPGWIRSHTTFCEQGQCVGPLPPLSRL